MFLPTVFPLLASSLTSCLPWQTGKDGDHMGDPIANARKNSSHPIRIQDFILTLFCKMLVKSTKNYNYLSMLKSSDGHAVWVNFDDNDAPYFYFIS